MHWLVFSLFLAVMAYLSPISVSATTHGSIVYASVDISSEKLNKQNTLLTNELKLRADQLTVLNSQQRQAEAVRAQIQADYTDALDTLKTVGRVDGGLGPLLRKHHDSLPEARYYTLRTKERAGTIAELGVRRMLHREEVRQLTAATAAIGTSENQSIESTQAESTESVRRLIKHRITLLEKSLQEDKIYLEALQLIDKAEHELLTEINDYDQFLREHLWWLRGAEPSRLSDITALLSLSYESLNLPWKIGKLRSYVEHLIRSPFSWLALVTAGIIYSRRKALNAAVQACSVNLGRVSKDRFVDTLKAFAWTLILAVPVPLLLLVASWQLSIWADHSRSSWIPITALLQMSGVLYTLQVLRWICIPGGVAEAHLRWSVESLQPLREELTRLFWILALAVLCVCIFYLQHTMNSLGVVSRLAFVLIQLALAISFFRIFHRQKGVFAAYFKQRKKSLLYRFYPPGFWFVVLLPIILAVEMLSGYVHSSFIVASMLLGTFALGIELLILYALGRRWLLVIYRRLAYDAAIERRKAILAERAARASGEEDETSAELVLEEPEVNLTELSDNASGLVGITIMFFGVVGLYLIWTPIFPALSIFDNVNLWYRTTLIDGTVQQVPTTIADIARAFLIVTATVILVSRLPSVLEIILLQRPSMSESDRYTLSKITAYTLVAIGGLLALNAIGASWSQLQWLVAALGVGIGFGLQEIVANFISGLIILFERPIRIGDVVTIDGTSGIVTKIRIRATTIRDWDRKELLVPNKDLITGRVLNWSLSDEMTRIVITVGVAYDSDIDTALELMRQAASEHENALKDPAPLLSFDSFGDYALVLTMRVYVSSISHRIKTITDLRKLINAKFQQAGISIAYPQRDLHLDTRDPLRIRIEPTEPATK